MCVSVCVINTTVSHTHTHTHTNTHTHILECIPIPGATVIN